ncbi:hypothetical protein GE21DRAFT_1340900, partial [Neurospora crassa]
CNVHPHASCSGILRYGGHDLHLSCPEDSLPEQIPHRRHSQRSRQTERRGGETQLSLGYNMTFYKGPAQISTEMVTLVSIIPLTALALFSTSSCHVQAPSVLFNRKYLEQHQPCKDGNASTRRSWFRSRFLHCFALYRAAAGGIRGVEPPKLETELELVYRQLC